MLYKAKALKGYTLDSYDGEIGKVMGFYFDDQHWTIRYLVADTGSWLVDKQVLISPYALVNVAKEEQRITINLTNEQIEESPSLNSDKPVSQQFEEDYYKYYEWPVYWAGPYMWGSYADIVRDNTMWLEASPERKERDLHLRSTKEVSGYTIHANDGDIGEIEDFIIDDEMWAIRYLIVNTLNWWPGKKVLLSPQWIKNVSWNESRVFVNLPREVIKQSPEYTDESLVTRAYEDGLHSHYNRQGYWIENPPRADYTR
ncbi:MAG: PRC-barrel domain-containing protein [Desulfuromonadaceae bacterium]|nr:PRC-barrel domain-containing protein [Desulfuromonadaceae bacterium]MDD5107012.1 PRC-barrel domain-containing protein [Desulfuromonadaceae bacterium]